MRTPSERNMWSPHLDRASSSSPSVRPARLLSLFVSFKSHYLTSCLFLIPTNSQEVQSAVWSTTPATAVYFRAPLWLAGGYHGGDIGCGFWRYDITTAEMESLQTAKRKRHRYVAPVKDSTSNFGWFWQQLWIKDGVPLQRTTRLQSSSFPQADPNHSIVRKSSYFSTYRNKMRLNPTRWPAVMVIKKDQNWMETVS